MATERSVRSEATTDSSLWPAENVYGSRKRVDWIAARIQPTDRIVEFGCGTGCMITLPLLASGFDVIGIDIDKGSIAYGRDTFRGHGLDQSRLQLIELGQLKVRPDVLIVSEVLEHIETGGLDAALEQLRESLAPSGRLLVTVPNGFGWFEIEAWLWNRAGFARVASTLRLDRVMDRVRRAVLGHTAEDPYPNTLADQVSPHVQRFTLSSIQALLSRHGFEVVDKAGSVMFAGPITNLFLRGITPFLRLNAWLGAMLPPLASGFYLECRVRDPDRAYGRARDRARDAARDVWGASPAGTAHGDGAAPGTRLFFDNVLRRRATHEIPWLYELVPFAAFRGQRVLELGCGAGFDAYELCRSGADYTGIDLAPENIERTRRHLELFGFGGNLQVADVERLPFPDGSFDVVFSNGVLHHASDIQRSIDEAFRVLQPGGHLWITVYHRNSVFYWLTLYLEHWLLRGDRHRYRSFSERVAMIEHTTSDARPLVNTYTRGELGSILERSGFAVRGLRVRKLTPEDLPTLPILARIWPRIPQRLLDRVGDRFGWYVVAHAWKPRA